MIRYELEDFPEQNFYRNLGESTRYGIEVDTSFIAFKNHMVQGGITFASYQFLEEGVQKNLPSYLNFHLLRVIRYTWRGISA